MKIDTYIHTYINTHIYIYIHRYIHTSLVPSKIFGPKRDEVKGEWRRLYNEELYDM